MPSTNNEKLEALTEQMKLLTQSRYLRREGQPWRYVSAAFFKGIAFGLGSFIGATIVVSIFLYFLSQMELFPVIGDWIGIFNDFLSRNQAPAPN